MSYDLKCPKCGHGFRITIETEEKARVRVAERKVAKATIQLRGATIQPAPNETIEVEATLDEGYPDCVLSPDIAERLGYKKHKEDKQHQITIYGGEKINVTGLVSTSATMDGHKIPMIHFRVSPNLPSGTAVIGRWELYELEDAGGLTYEEGRAHLTKDVERTILKTGE